jgi:broad specificity phosphatase PhoE
VTRTLSILLLRHGQTDANATGTIQGHLPTPLNPLGRRQAQLLAGRLARLSPPIDVLISSDLPRAAQTAEPIAAACGVPLRLDPSWRERYLGSFQGKTVGDRGIWLAATGHTDTPDAEPVDDMLARTRRALTTLPTTYPHAAIIAVMTHGGPCKMVQRLLAERHLPVTPGHALIDPANSPNCSLTHLTYDRAAGVWSLACLHDVTHLADLATSADAG